MEVHKKGQARNYRVIFAVIIVLLGIFAAWKWFDAYRGDPIFGLPLDWIGAAFCIVASGFAGFYFAFVNKKSVEYVIDTDDEMRKVTWPSKEELRANAIIVVIVMVVLGVITTLLDSVFVQMLNLFKTWM